MKNQNECKRCGHKWESRVDSKACPRCKSYYWRTESRYKAEKEGGER